MSGSRPVDLPSHLQRSLRRTVYFLRERGRRISPARSAFFLLTSISLCEIQQETERASFRLFLGVTLDFSLAWNQHGDMHGQRAKRSVNESRLISITFLGVALQPLVRQTLRFSLPLMHGLPASLEERLTNVLVMRARVCLAVCEPPYPVIS